ncbi:MAG: hypothetical protein K2N12_03905 [Helicobacter sp.]|nr:hypothetical protein [Helicobacter sp.]
MGARNFCCLGAFARDSVWNFGFFYVLHCGIARDFVRLLPCAWLCLGFMLACLLRCCLGARDSVLNLDFGDVGFKKESLLVFVSFLGKRSLFGKSAKMKNGNFLGDCVSGSEVGFLKVGLRNSEKQGGFWHNFGTLCVASFCKRVIVGIVALVW